MFINYVYVCLLVILEVFITCCNAQCDIKTGLNYFFAGPNPQPQTHHRKFMSISNAKIKKKNMLKIHFLKITLNVLLEVY